MNYASGLIQSQRIAVLDLLESEGKVDSAALGRAQLLAERSRQPVEQVLNQLGALSDSDLAAAYAKVSGCEVWTPDDRPLMESSSLPVTPGFLKRHRMLPVRYEDETLVCAVCDPLDEEAIAGLAFAVGGSIRLLVARLADWRVASERTNADASSENVAIDERRLERDLDQVLDVGDDGDGARLVTGAFDAAVAGGASDIHFEPRRHDFRIRFRIDGRLVDHRVVSADLAAPAISRLKVIAQLNLGEHRLPQDGRTSFVVGGRQIDVRVATTPTVFGEAAVLRLLDRTSVPLDIEALGFSADVIRVFRQAVASPHGLFLVTGPTGSGKTTTLYSLLQTFANSTRKVLSVEDPVEFHFPHVLQTQVAPNIGLTFATALRSFLRLDPDVILVGEIRDPETASVAIQAAMTGHLVLASVHANDALAVVPRLLDIGIEPYQLAAGLRGVAAQRLVRRVCTECREMREPEGAELVLFDQLGKPRPQRLSFGRGCASCGGDGFKGRVAIGEAFVAEPTLLRAIAQGASSETLKALAAEAGFVSMLADGLEKMVAGVTTSEEVLAAVHA